MNKIMNKINTEGHGTLMWFDIVLQNEVRSKTIHVDEGKTSCVAKYLSYLNEISKHFPTLHEYLQWHLNELWVLEAFGWRFQDLKC